MPHATQPSPGFQAFILCGPGASLSTFTSEAQTFPKALVPIANRPMVWYPLEWCYRMGVTNITLVTPPESRQALEDELDRNPHLTSLPAPKADVLAPAELTQTSGTGDLFRCSEVQAAIEEDFIVLPCDLVCELEGASLVDTWMIQQAGLGSSTEEAATHGRGGALTVWYQTKEEGADKNTETDFLATTPLTRPIVPPPQNFLAPDVSKLVLSMPTDTLNDRMDEQKGLRIRHGLLKKHGRIRMRTTYRDSHIYLFPYWVKDFIQRNDEFESISEDVLGWWAKATWQDGLAQKLSMDDVLKTSTAAANGANNSTLDGEEVHVASLSSTWTTHPAVKEDTESPFASRVLNSSLPTPDLTKFATPSVLAYVQPTDPALPLIRRVDTAHLLLQVSLRLAKQQSIEEAHNAGVTPSPFAHPTKVHHSSPVPRQCRVEEENSLVAENVTISEKCNVKESVIGANCKIGVGARLLRCMLMDGVEVGDNVQLTGCIIGKRCKLEGGARSDDMTKLTDVEVQDGYFVKWGTEVKKDKMMRFEGLEEDQNGEGMDDMDEDGNDLEAETVDV